MLASAAKPTPHQIARVAELLRRIGAKALALSWLGRQGADRSLGNQGKQHGHDQDDLDAFAQDRDERRDERRPECTDRACFEPLDHRLNGSRQASSRDDSFAPLRPLARSPRNVLNCISSGRTACGLRPRR